MPIIRTCGSFFACMLFPFIEWNLDRGTVLYLCECSVCNCTVHWIHSPFPIRLTLFMVTVKCFKLIAWINIRLKILAPWDVVTLYHWLSSPDVSNIRITFMFGVKQSKKGRTCLWTAWPWRWVQSDTSKRGKALTQRTRLTSQTT
jgi:hypothetical protein